MDDTAVNITFTSTSVQPPLFIAGSFSSPPWVPQEMDHAEKPRGERVFSKTVHVRPGSSFQYKFRVGLGDWWILDEKKPTITDDMGNRNNLMETRSSEAPPTPPPDSPTREMTGKGREEKQKYKQAKKQEGVSTPPAIVEADGPDVVFAYEVSDMGPEFAHENPGIGPSDGQEEGPPMFAYELAAAEPAKQQQQRSRDSSPVALSPARPQVLEEAAIDFADPTLMKFPSSRDKILQTVQSIQTGLDEDQASFDGVPRSPVVHAGRAGSLDLGQNGLSLSPSRSPSLLPSVLLSPVSPTSPKASPSSPGSGRRADIHRNSLSRSSLDRTPLDCIAEEAGAGDHEADESTAPVSPTSQTSQTSTVLQMPTVKKPKPASTYIPPGVGTLVDEPPRSTTSASYQSAGMETAPPSNWFAAFIRIVFVDWIGMFFQKVFRWGKR